MYTTEGTLRVRLIDGRYGVFAVGSLTTPIGVFTVKDPELDQFESGEYTGTFGIAHIAPRSYVHGGRLVVEVRAELGFMEIDNVDERVVEEEEDVADPIVEMEKPLPAEPEKREEPKPKPAVKTAEPVDQVNDTEELFGSEIYEQLMAGADEVKLDSTVDRATLRKQVARMHTLDYEFDSTVQVWRLTVGES